MRNVFKNTIFFYFLIFVFSVVAIIPFVMATVYLHPNVDDFYFAKIINDKGTFGFVIDFYNQWSGRYFANFLLGLPKSDPIHSRYLYTLLPIFFMISIWFVIYKLAYLFLKHNLQNWKIAILSLFFFSFYITSLYELFSALFWNCASYYMFWNVFFIWFIYEFISYFLKEKEIKSFSFLKLCLLVILIAGLSEIFIISLIVGLSSVIFYQYYFKKVFRYDVLVLLVLIVLGGYFNLFSPGSQIRMQTSLTEHPNIIIAAIRAAYDFVILQLSPLLYSGFFVLAFLVFIFGKTVLDSYPQLKHFFNIPPLYTIFTGLFIFYLHHAMSVYGAGYVLQGRIINVTNLLLYLFVIFTILNVINYYKINITVDKKNGLMVVLLISFLMNFSLNSRIVGRDVVSYLPIFDKEMKARYDKILKAKNNGENVVYVDRISVPLRSFNNSPIYTPNKNFYNSKIFCRDAAIYFEINIRIKNDEYDQVDFDVESLPPTK